MTRTFTESSPVLRQDTQSSVPPTGTIRRSTQIGVVIGLLVLGGILRFYQLGTKGLWGDEIWTAQWSKGTIDQIWTSLTLIPDMPLMYALVNFSTRFGGSEFWVRLPSALFGVAGLLMFFFLVSRIFGRRTALVGIALITFSPIHIWYSQDARYYAQLSFLGIASVYFFYAFLTSDKIHFGTWLAYLLATVAALYMHLFAGWVVVAQGMFAIYFLLDRVWRPGEDKQTVRGTAANKALWLLAALLVIAVCTYPITLRLVETLQTGTSPGGEGMARLQFPPLWPVFLTPAFLTDLVQRFSGGRLATFVLLPFFLVGAVTTWRYRRDVGVLVLCLIFAPILTTFFLDTEHGVSFKYFLHLLPFYLLLVVEGMVQTAARLTTAVNAWTRQDHSPIHRRVTRLLQNEHAALLGLLLCIIVIYVRPISLVYEQARVNDWRSLAAYLTKNVQPGDVVFTERWGRNALAYYLPPASEIKILESNPERWRRRSYLASRIWLVGLNGQFEQQTKGYFQRIADSSWQDPRWVYDIDLQADMVYPINEPAASIYVFTQSHRSPMIDFMDIDDADWTDVTYRHVSPGQETAVDLTLQAAAPRELALRYLDHPGKNLQVLADGQVLGSVTGGFLNGWQTWRSHLPEKVGDTVRITIVATGPDAIGLDTVELSYISPPPVSVVMNDQPVAVLAVADQGTVIFDEPKNNESATEANRRLNPGDTIQLTLSIPDQTARILIVTTSDLSGQSLAVEANGYSLGVITGSHRGDGRHEAQFVVPGGMGESVLIQIRALGPNLSTVQRLDIQRF